MDDKFDIQAYLTRGVENIVSGALRATLKDPRESAFMVRFAAASRKASQRRAEAEKAGELPNILFPIFTNGTYMDDAYFRLFDACRNLIPVLSIEGGRAETDQRRGAGIYDRQIANMDTLHEKGLLFGASVTVTTQNGDEAVSPGFIDALADRGCKLVIYVEYVPVTEESRELAPGEPERVRLREGDLLADDHAGGCVLFEKRADVEAILAARLLCRRPTDPAPAAASAQSAVPCRR